MLTLTCLLSTLILPVNIGSIKIVGNVDSHEGMIRRHIDFFPGQRVPVIRLLNIQAKLINAGWWKNAAVFLDQSSLQYYDVIIQIEEQPMNWFVYSMAEFQVWLVTLDSQRLNYIRERIYRGLRLH